MIENGKILLDVKEDNVAFEKENFDIEFFEILNPYEQDKEEILKRLFLKKKAKIS